MLPTRDQIERAAYLRWLGRGGEHGRDREDWIAAQQDLIFAQNYETIARYELNDGAKQFVGDPARRKCRFCEQSFPRATFEATPLVFPPVFGNTTLVAGEECDACHALFLEHLEKPFEAFARPFLADAPRRAAIAETSCPGPSIPIAAFKCLVKMALAIMPEDELPSFEDTIEWVCNPIHRQDFSVFRGLSCRVYLTPVPIPAPWASLARRIEDDAPFPAMLFSASTPNVVFQVPLPLSMRDDDMDVEEVRTPMLSIPCGTGAELRESRCLDLPIAPPT
ncbi:MAG: DUF2934 domain-containing protein [Planctomycetaceae bacterium]